MSLLDRLTGLDRTAAADVQETLQLAETRDQLEQAHADLQLLAESLADVELALDDRGWRLLGIQTDRALSPEGRRKAAVLARTMAVVNPLIRRALSIRTSYVWGGGVDISARATGDNEGNPDEQDVNAVVQAFLEDPATRKVLTSAEARETNERTLGTDGTFAVACFTNPRTGAVQIRPIPAEQLTEVLYNPEDGTEPWFYKRVWSERQLDGTSRSRTALYPHIAHRPRGPRAVRYGGERVKGQRINGVEILWDAPVLVLDVNRMADWDFGIGDAFAALPWARAYKEFLEDWAKLVKALSRFAWRLTSSSKGKAQAAASRVREAVAPGLAPDAIGGIAASGPGTALEAIPKSGATIDSDSGKPLAAMVAAAMDVPVTMLLSDPGQTGARAVAETLDTPTENAARLRRELWSDFYRDLLGYVIDQAVKAPQGPLRGSVIRDEWDREIVILAGDTDRTIEFDWPDLSSMDTKDMIEAIAKADDTGKLPPLTTVRLLLTALGVKDADELIEKVTDDDGNWIDPLATAGDVAVDAFRRGEDPARRLDPVVDVEDEDEQD